MAEDYELIYENFLGEQIYKYYGFHRNRNLKDERGYFSFAIVDEEGYLADFPIIKVKLPHIFIQYEKPRKLSDDIKDTFKKIVDDLIINNEIIDSNYKYMIEKTILTKG